MHFKILHVLIMIICNKLIALEQQKAFLYRCCNQLGSSLLLPFVAVTNSHFLIYDSNEYMHDQFKIIRSNTDNY